MNEEVGSYLPLPLEESSVGTGPFIDLSPVPMVQGSLKNLFHSAVKRWSQDSNASLFDSKVHTLGHINPQKMSNVLGVKGRWVGNKTGTGIRAFSPSPHSPFPFCKLTQPW